PPFGPGPGEAAPGPPPPAEPVVRVERAEPARVVDDLRAVAPRRDGICRGDREDPYRGDAPHDGHGQQPASYAPSASLVEAPPQAEDDERDHEGGAHEHEDA